MIFSTHLRFLVSIHTALARQSQGWFSTNNPNIVMGALLPCTFLHRNSENRKDGGRKTQPEKNKPGIFKSFIGTAVDRNEKQVILHVAAAGESSEEQTQN